MKKTRLQISLIGLIIFPLACVFLILLYIILNGTNHTGLEFLSVLAPRSLTLVASAFILAPNRHNKLALAACACNIIAVVFFFAVAKFDIMVQYDRWLERGMPAPFERHIFGR